MLQGFKQFILRGNVLDLAVAVVMGVAFGAVVTALVKDLITPFIAAIVGKPDFSAIEFTINGSKFLIGDFINAVISFILIAAAVYFFIVLPMNCFSLECGAERRPPIRRLRNAPSASAKYLSRHDAALSAPPRSPKPRRAERHCFAHIYLYLDRFRLRAQRPLRIRNSRFASGRLPDPVNEWADSCSIRTSSRPPRLFGQITGVDP